MAAFSVLVTNVQTALTISATSSFFSPTFIKQYINEAQIWLGAAYNWPMLERSGIFYTVAGTETYSYPTVATTSEIFKTDGMTRIEVNNWNDTGATYAGTWNATTNSPALASSVGTTDNYYVCTVAGSTTLDSVTSWIVGDIVFFDGSTWTKPTYTPVEHPKFLFEAYKSFREDYYEITDQTGLQRMVADRNRTIYIYPVPVNTGLLVTCYGTVQPTTLTADGDVTFCDVAEKEMDECILHKAIAQGFRKAMMYGQAEVEEAYADKLLNGYLGKLKKKQQRYRTQRPYFDVPDYFASGSAFEGDANYIVRRTTSS
jgi:hypothetical protein